MKLKDFIGKVVVSPKSKKRYELYRITAPEIEVVTVEPDSNGYHTHYSWKTINGDPISNGQLVFEDSSLLEAFQTIYEAHCRSKDGYWEEYGYWMRRD